MKKLYKKYRYINEFGSTWIPYYQVPGRHYHTVEHITGMFEVANSHGIKLTNAQSLAIAFHDAIYIPGYKNNEDASIALMRTVVTPKKFSTWFTQDDIDTAASIIRSTIQHRPLVEEAEVIIDLDLVGLASNYEVNGRKVRLEFSHLTDEEYKQGRIMFLRHMLSKIELFYTDPFIPYENVARKNIADELKILESR